MSKFVKITVLLFIAVLAIFLITGGFMGSNSPMVTVLNVDINRFMGDWYVIANIPTFIERNAVNAVESYALREDGDVDITFTFSDKTPEGEKKEYTALGFINDRETNAEWRVQFFWPIKFPYKVIGLDVDYTYTVIGVPSRKYVWIMSRTPRMDEQTYTNIVDLLEKDYGYDKDKIQKVIQDWRGNE
ncbi:lipocalin family protein [candidate division KSB1 bacterium]